MGTTVYAAAPVVSKPDIPLKPALTLPDMVALKGGCFQIVEEPIARQACVKDFSIGKYEVTQALWQAVMDENPAHFLGEQRPVERVGWKDVNRFLEKLNAKTGKNYRLPTEDEWFFACQAGEKQDYCGSNTLETVAWYAQNAGKTTHPVGTKAANAWGLFDMSGNVMEWASRCEDGDCSGRVLRGGSWRGVGLEAASVIRLSDLSNYRFDSIGFRLALDN